MQGAGTIQANSTQLTQNGGKGTLEYLVGQPSLSHIYGHLVKSKGQWVERDDVYIIYQDRAGPLSVGYGSDSSHIGSELQFGHVLGDYLILEKWAGEER